eukprot:Pgem_evm1s9772
MQKYFTIMKSKENLVDIITYNTILEINSKKARNHKNKTDSKIFWSDLLKEMKQKGIKPDVNTYNIIMKFDPVSKFKTASCAINSAQNVYADHCLRLFKEMQEMGLVPNVYSYSILINALTKCREMDLAHQYLIDMNDKGITPNLITFSIMIDGYFHVN